MELKNLCLLYLISISCFDIRDGRIPNSITLMFFSASLLADFFVAPEKILPNIFCAFFYFFIFYAAVILTKRIGSGDSKMAAAVGYRLGFLGTSIALLFACLACIAFFLIVFPRDGRKSSKLPFAPFVAAGYILSEFLCWRKL